MILNVNEMQTKKLEHEKTSVKMTEKISEWTESWCTKSNYKYWMMLDMYIEIV